MFLIKNVKFKIKNEQTEHAKLACVLDCACPLVLLESVRIRVYPWFQPFCAFSLLASLRFKIRENSFIKGRFKRNRGKSSEIKPNQDSPGGASIAGFSRPLKNHKQFILNALCHRRPQNLYSKKARKMTQKMHVFPVCLAGREKKFPLAYPGRIAENCIVINPPAIMKPQMIQAYENLSSF